MIGRRRSSARLLAFAYCGLTASGSAQPAASPVLPYRSLTWTREVGAEQCPDAEHLRRLVARYLGYGAFSPDAERSVDARVIRTPKGLSASYRIVDPAGRLLAARELHAPNADCRSLTISVAFTLALAVDPAVATRQPAVDDDDAPQDSPAVQAAPQPATPPFDSSDSMQTTREGAPRRDLATATPRSRSGPAVIALDHARLGVLTTLGMLPHSGLGAEIASAWQLRLPAALEVGASFIPQRARSVNRGVRIDTGSSQAWVGLQYAWAQRDVWAAHLHAALSAGILHVGVSSPRPSDPPDLFVSSVRAGPRLTYRLAGAAAAYCSLDASLALQRANLWARRPTFSLWEQSPIAIIAGCGGAFVAGH